MKKARIKTSTDAHAFIDAVAAHHGWHVNPDAGFAEVLAGGLAANYNRFGYYQCPCRDSWAGDRKKDADIICPCVYSKADLDEYGQCYCGLFVTAELAQSGRGAASIPERRPQELFP